MNATAPSPAQLAKLALKRLAEERREPTPQNFAHAYEAEQRTAGLLPALTEPPPINEVAAASAEQAVATPQQEQAWSKLLSQLLRGLETSHRQWTAARKKESLQRVMQGSRHDNQKLHDRLHQLVLSWENLPQDDVGVEVQPLATSATATATHPATGGETTATLMSAEDNLGHAPWMVSLLSATVDTALPATDPTAEDARQSLHTSLENTWHTLQQRPDEQRLSHVQADLAQACQQTQRVIEHRQHLTEQLVSLCHVLTDSMMDLVEDDSWVQGQCEAVRSELSQGLSYRGTRRIQQLVEDARLKQKGLQQERQHAKQALRDLIHQMLQELSQLDETTGQFQDRLSTYADTIGQAQSLESLTDVVKAMVQDSRTVHDVVSQTQAKLQSEHARASELTQRVQELEQEIRKLSDEVSTDPLTQIANRRGLLQIFSNERTQAENGQKPLSIGLLDIDNFKKLNDTLGHQTGDEALKFLAQRVVSYLRPQDAVARYGGEEFVVILPDTDTDTGQQILTRLQRQLSGEFFEHDDQRVFITFSAGVTTYRAGEAIENTLDRADVALYEAKRTGKNRTCTA